MYNFTLHSTTKNLTPKNWRLKLVNWVVNFGVTSIISIGDDCIILVTFNRRLMKIVLF